MSELSYSFVDPKKLELLLEQNYAQTKAVFIVLKNVQAEVQSLQTETKKLRSAVLALLADPKHTEEAAAVIRKFNQERHT